MPSLTIAHMSSQEGGSGGCQEQEEAAAPDVPRSLDAVLSSSLSEVKQVEHLCYQKFYFELY